MTRLSPPQAASLFKPLLCAREIEFPPDFDPINFTLYVYLFIYLFYVIAILEQTA